MLKIEIDSANPAEMWLRLAGKLSNDHLPELERLLDEAQSSGRRVGFVFRPLATFQLGARLRLAIVGEDTLYTFDDGVTDSRKNRRNQRV